MPRTRRFASFALFLLAACSAQSADNGGVDEGATVIDPQGEDSPSELLVTLPSGVTNVEKTTVSSAGFETDLGKPLGPLPVGPRPFSMSTSAQTYSMSSGSVATMTASQTTTIQAAVLAVNAIPQARTLGLGPDLSTMQIHIEGPAGHGFVAATSDGSRAVPVLEGNYEVRFGIDDGVPVQLHAGEIKTVNLNDFSARRVTRLKAPTRTLADVDCGFGGAAPARAWSLHGASETRYVTVDDGKELDIGVSPASEGAQLAISNVAWTTSVGVPFGARGAGPMTWELGRIDVLDVKVNGAAERVRGTFNVYAADSAGNRMGDSFLRCTPATNSGVDVPPGKWRVEVHYDSVESGPKTDVHVVDVP